MTKKQLEHLMEHGLADDRWLKLPYEEIVIFLAGMEHAESIVTKTRTHQSRVRKSALSAELET